MQRVRAVLAVARFALAAWALGACSVDCVCTVADPTGGCGASGGDAAAPAPDGGVVAPDGGVGAPDSGAVPVAGCPVTCADGATCVRDDDDEPLAVACAAGVARMAPLVRACGFEEAVALALADGCGGSRSDGADSGGGARVLWFEAGAAYRITAPVVIDAPGIEVRGDGAPAYAFDAPDERRQGTVFRCAVPKGEACLSLLRRPGSGWRSGFRIEGVTVLWDGEHDGADVTGLLVQNAEDVVVRDVVFEDFPGTAVAASGVSSSRFADLAFVSPAGVGGTALAFSCGPTDDPSEPSVCPNGNVLSGLHVEGYAVGVHYVSGNAVTIENSVFTNARRNALLLDGVESLRVTGCRFMDVQEAPSEDDAYVRILRDEGWWYPDVVVDVAYFQCHCRAGRWPIAAEIGGTSATPRPRVAIRDSTFQNCPEGVFLRGDARTAWECSGNRVTQKVSSAPTRYETWTLDDCATDDALPPQPETCAE